MTRFRDREEAGQRLAAALAGYAGRPEVRVLALPRGGVPVAFQVACALGAPLDVFIVRKLGAPGYEELAMGAIASGGIVVLNDRVIQALGVGQRDIDRVAEAERRELQRREQSYRGGRPGADIAGRTAIVVDDGLATGATMRAAVAALRPQAPARIVVAVPVAARDTCEALRAEVDELVCLRTPDAFHAVGAWYDDFTQTGDEEVHRLLDLARQGCPRPPPAAAGGDAAGAPRRAP